MEYKKIIKAEFAARPNRFIAYVRIGDQMETVHVKNTGRCRELLTENAVVYLEEPGNPGRKTKYDLVAVKKGSRLVNMDSAAPNKAVGEWLRKETLFHDVVKIRPETTYGSSRFDFYVETKKDRIFLEVKGVTLEQNDVVLFPDAPSERAVKHVKELIQAKSEGYLAYLVFVIQMSGVKYFTPNRSTHPEFAKVLEEAQKAGVKLLAYDCHVWEQGMEIENSVPVRLQTKEQLNV